MLKNVCDRCGKVIDGDGNMPDYNAFDAYIDDEPVVSYIHLCDKCREKIIDILTYNIEGKKRPQKKKEAPKKSAPKQHPKTEDSEVQPEIEVSEIINNFSGNDKLAEKVVKRIPLPKPPHHEVSGKLFDD